MPSAFTPQTTNSLVRRFYFLERGKFIAEVMKKLPDDERLKRGIQVLLNDQDQEDLRKMAEAKGMSLSGILRMHIQAAIEDWRAQEKGKRKRKK